MSKDKDNFPALCQSLLKDEASLRTYTENNLHVFFAQFYQFLSQYQKPPHQGAFKKRNQVKTIEEVLSNVLSIIPKASLTYKSSMKNDINNIFAALLHPMTPDRVRQPAISIFFALIDRFGEQPDGLFEGIYRLVYDFSPLKDDCKPGSNFDLKIDPKYRIQTVETETTSKEQLLKSIEKFEQDFNNLVDAKVALYFKIFMKMILIPAYSSIKQSNFGIVGPVPLPLHNSIVKVLSNMLKRESNFKMAFKGTIDYFFEAAEQSVLEHNGVAGSFDYVVKLFTVLQKNPDCLKGHSIELICKGNLTLLALLNASLKKQPKERMKVIKTTFFFFQACFRIFESDRVKIAQLYTTWPKAESLPQVLTILLCTLIELKCGDDELWSLMSKPGPLAAVFLDSFAYFAAFYGIAVASELLSFTYADLQKCLQLVVSQDEWLGEQYTKIRKLKITEKSVDTTSFFAEESNYFSPSVPQNTRKVAFNLINKENWVPFVKTIKGMEYSNISDPEIQFRTYLVGASFVNSLVKLITCFPPGMRYKVDFIMEHFLDWLKESCSTTSTNEKILLFSLDILGTMLNDPMCIRSFSEESAVDWILTLQAHMKSTNPRIKTKAVNLACSAILNGIFGSSRLLNDDIAKNLLIPNEKLVDLHISTVNSIELTEMIDTQIRASYLLRILMENVYKKQNENIEKIISSILNLLKRGEISDVYNLWPIVLFVKELKEINEEILNNFITEVSALVDKSESHFADALLQFLSDLIVYSASKTGIEKFLTLSDKFKQKYVILYISKYFNNLSFQDYSSNRNDKQFFTNGNQEILQLYEKNKFASNLAIGHSAYQFDHPEIVSSDAVVIPQYNFSDSLPISDPKDYEIQTDFNTTIANFFNENLFKPGDFNDIVDTDFQKEEENSLLNKLTDNYTQKLIDAPLNYGPLCAAFMSSTGLTDPVSSSRLIPCGFPAFTANVDLSYKKNIDVGLWFTNETTKYKLFESGIGGADAKNQTVTYADCRNRIIFHKNSSEKARTIEVVWGITDAASFLPETLARIQIYEAGENYLVKTLFKKGTNPPAVLTDAVVSPSALPTFVIARIMTISKLLDEPKRSIDSAQESAEALRHVEEENFPQRSGTFGNERVLISID